MYIFNIIMPTFLLFTFVWYLALIAIVGNLMIDAGIYHWFFNTRVSDVSRIGKYVWKAYFLGFLADFIGAGILVLLYSFTRNEISYFQIFDSWYNVLVHVIIIGVTGVIIYWFNRWNLKNSGFTDADIHRLSLLMAIITAPYTFLIPASAFGY